MGRVNLEKVLRIKEKRNEAEKDGKQIRRRSLL